MAGVAIFDSALIIYPLYQTSKYVVNGIADKLNGAMGEQEEIDVSEICDSFIEGNRWLTFWLTFGLIQLVQGLGADSIPGFHLVKGIIILSLYSVEHGMVIGSMIPRICHSYLIGTKKINLWWNESALPKVTEKAREVGWIRSMARTYLSYSHPGLFSQKDD